MCNLHYHRWYRNGDPLKTLRGKVERICQNPECGSTFSVPPSKVKEGKGKYCSQGCYSTFGRVGNFGPRDRDVVCSVDDGECGYDAGRYLTKGLCRLHYQRYARLGTTSVVRRKACPSCSEWFDYKRSDVIACSQLCYARLRDGRSPRRHCVDCGTDITASRGGGALLCEDHRKSRIVDRNRRRSGHIGARGLETACSGCGIEMVIKTRKKRFCSPACVMWRLRHPDGEMRPREAECRDCGAGFAPRVAAVQKYCSPQCGARAAKRRRAHRDRAAFIEDVDRFILGERDEWLCGICGGAIDPDAIFPDRMSWSVDHIVPVSLGGEHSYANTQSAHWLCNVRKGANLPDQGMSNGAV